ncbi:hypothetical protein [Lysinibacillus sp. FJAT-14222]|nr:hypothetical protein [Lysinibacillus sp. FJAT-14222]KOS61497.1 hypothetical protein AN161_18075 [Lysinibacillus sp. FJAT-14222]
MNKPYTIIFNPKGIAVITIDNRIADDESRMIQRFKDVGYIVTNVTEETYKEITNNRNFCPF